MAKSPAIPKLYNEKGEVEWDWTNDLPKAERDHVLQTRKHNRGMLRRMKITSILTSIRKRIKPR